MRAWCVLPVLLLCASFALATTTTITFDGASYVDQPQYGTSWSEGGYTVSYPNTVSLIKKGQAPNRVLGFQYEVTQPYYYAVISKNDGGRFALRYLEYWDVAATINVLANQGPGNITGTVSIGNTAASSPHALYFPTNGTFDCLTAVWIQCPSGGHTNMIYLDNIVVEACGGCTSSPCVTPSPPPVARPSTLLYYPPVMRHLFFRRPSDKGVEHIGFNNSAIAFAVPYDIWTYLASGVAAEGNINAISDTSQQHVFYRNTAGQVGHIYYNGGYGYDNWAATEPIAGDPTSLYDGYLHLFYRGTDNHLNHIYWNGYTYWSDQWDVLGAAPLAFGNPAAIFALNQQHLFYRGADGHIDHLYWWIGGSLTFDRWTYLKNAPLSAGDPALLANGNQLHLFYRGTDGNVNRIYWNGTALVYDQWSILAGAPAAVGDIATAIYGTEIHTFHRTSEGNISHIWWNGFMHHDVWSDPSYAYTAAGDPTTMSIGNELHIFYFDTNGYLRHVWWNGSVLTGEVWLNPI